MSLERGIGTATEQVGGDVLFLMNDGWLRILAGSRARRCFG
jgi:hypothetical protein